MKSLLFARKNMKFIDKNNFIHIKGQGLFDFLKKTLNAFDDQEKNHKDVLDYIAMCKGPYSLIRKTGKYAMVDEYILTCFAVDNSAEKLSTIYTQSDQSATSDLVKLDGL
ncbi:hypothetical protein EBR43_02060 [bacterium]|nr:hypothetical protein [bacterium]NBX72479.1 hypothetical protein [bacterium]